MEARDYQVKLFEESLKENVLVWLETGAGKSFIAVLLMQELAYQTTAAYGCENGKRTLFLANSVALVKQQATYLDMHLNMKVKFFVG